MDPNNNLTPPMISKSDGPYVEDWLSKLFSVLGWGILSIVLYILASIIYIIFYETNNRSLLQTDNFSDISLAILHLETFSIIAAIGIGYGFLIAKQSGKSARLLVFSFLPMTVIGIILWYVCYHNSGPMTDYESMDWLLYKLYVYWAVPGNEFIRHYVPIGWVPYIGLLASLFPSLFACIGAALYPLAHKSWSRTQVLVSIIGAPCCMAICFAASLIIPSFSEFTPQSYPRVDGATAAIPLGQELSHRLTGMNRPQTERAVQFSTTHYAYVNLITNKADLILVAGPSDEELQLAQQNGVTLKLTPIGKDAFIFLVHQNNPVDTLTVAQFQAIYSGKIKNWLEVDGTDDVIATFQREANSGSQTFMETKVMQGIPMLQATRKQKITGMGNMIDEISEYANASNAIGYSFYYYASEMHKRDHVKFLKVNGIESNKQNIRTSSYPFTATLYAVTREGEPQNEPTARLLSWLQSDKGAAAIEKGGFIPIR